jgi:hypothetical protein
MPDPALQYIPDTVDGSEIEHNYTSSTRIRGGLVVGLHGDPSQALEQIIAASGMPKFGDVINSNGRTLYLKNIRAKAIGADMARVALTYDSVFSSETSSAYLIRTRSYLTTYETNMLPGTRVPIRIDLYADPDHGFNVVPADNVTFRFQRPMRSIEVSGLKFGAPPTDDKYEKNIGYANAGPFRGLARGYWVLTDGGVDLSRYKGFYTWNLSALTRNTEDWSETGILRDSRTGKFVNVLPADIAALLALPYDYGIIGKRNGIIRVGPYPVTDFATLFGFSSTGLFNILDGLDLVSPGTA